jgi:hypothetical protein
MEVKEFAARVDCPAWDDLVTLIEKGWSMDDAAQSACQGCLEKQVIEIVDVEVKE